MITEQDIRHPSLQLIVDEGIREGFSGRPLKRFVRRKLAKIVKKAMKKVKRDS